MLPKHEDEICLPKIKEDNSDIDIRLSAIFWDNQDKPV